MSEQVFPTSSTTPDPAASKPAIDGASSSAQIGLHEATWVPSLGAARYDDAWPSARNDRALPDATISEYLGIQTNNVAEGRTVTVGLGRTAGTLAFADAVIERVAVPHRLHAALPARTIRGTTEA